MFAADQIQRVHLEISTLCNAACPWCPRTFWGYPYNNGYPELNFTLQHAKHIFTSKFIKQLINITINGNYGDAVMNPETPDIVEYFRYHNPELDIEISTNGGARSDEFWQRLAHAQARVIFALDGLEDTHHLYRQNTVWATVIKNAQTFIQAGGRATWQMIKFKHNQHQITPCENLAKQMGFSKFALIDSERTEGPVYNKQGELTHVLGDYRGETNLNVLLHKKMTDTILLEDVKDRPINQPIICQVKTNKSIFVAANGDVSPCCWTGLYPKTYGAGQYHQPINEQLNNILKKNNALEYSIEECIKWFEEVEKSWTIPTFEQGRLIICNDTCGRKNNK